jgi:hypothetical protein
MLIIVQTASSLSPSPEATVAGESFGEGAKDTNKRGTFLVKSLRNEYAVV